MDTAWQFALFQFMFANSSIGDSLMVKKEGAVAVCKNGNSNSSIDLSTVRIPRVKAFNPFDIKPLEGQIRERFFGIQDLANSILEIGQVTPVIVRELKGGPFKAHLVDGERRLLACRLARVGVAAFIWDGVTDPEEIYALSVAANFGRQAHDCMEIAKAIQRFRKNGKTIEQIARVFGKCNTWVIQHYSLVKLHPVLQDWLIPRNPATASVKDRAQRIGMDAMVSTGSKKTRPPLTFSLALLLVRQPKKDQLVKAKRIVEEKMSLAEARRYILSAGAPKSSHWRHRPVEQRKTLLSISNRVRHMVGVFLDMRGSKFDALLAGATLPELRGLKSSLLTTASDVTQLAECVESDIASRQGKKVD